MCGLGRDTFDKLKAKTSDSRVLHKGLKCSVKKSIMKENLSTNVIVRSDQNKVKLSAHNVRK